MVARGIRNANVQCRYLRTLKCAGWVQGGYLMKVTGKMTIAQWLAAGAEYGLAFDTATTNGELWHEEGRYWVARDDGEEDFATLDEALAALMVERDD